MAKIIKLTEADLTRLVKRVIKEQNSTKRRLMEIEPAPQGFIKQQPPASDNTKVANPQIKPTPSNSKVAQGFQKQGQAVTPFGINLETNQGTFMFSIDNVKKGPQGCSFFGSYRGQDFVRKIDYSCQQPTNLRFYSATDKAPEAVGVSEKAQQLLAQQCACGEAGGFVKTQTATPQAQTAV